MQSLTRKRAGSLVIVGLGAAGFHHYRAQTSEQSIMLSAVRAQQGHRFLVGRTAVVVGATSGIGEGCALRLAEAGCSVIAVGRDLVRGAAVTNACAERSAAVATLTDRTKPSHSFIQCDAFDLKDVKGCAAQIIAKHHKIDALVLTQGMATIQGFTPTPDGNDQKLTLHYFSRMAFASQLLPALRCGEEPRVISVLSGGVHSPFAGYREDFELKSQYSIKNAADAAGFYTDLGLDALAHREGSSGPVVFVHSAPGFVNTRWGTEMPWYIRGLVRLIQPFGRSAGECAEFMLAPVFHSKKELLDGTRGDVSSGTDGRTGVVVLDQYAQPAALTLLHSVDARDFVWERTEEVLRRADVTLGT